MKDLEQRLALAEALISGFNKEIKSADKLSKRPRNVYERVDSVKTKKLRELRATSVNDILDSTDTAWLLDCPEFRDKLRAISSELNSAKKS